MVIDDEAGILENGMERGLGGLLGGIEIWLFGWLGSFFLKIKGLVRMRELIVTHPVGPPRICPPPPPTSHHLPCHGNTSPIQAQNLPRHIYHTQPWVSANPFSPGYAKPPDRSRHKPTTAQLRFNVISPDLRCFFHGRNFVKSSGQFN